MDRLIREQIAKHFEWYYEKGYITHRDGNAAYRTINGYDITVSGVRKNCLMANLDFMDVDENLNNLYPTESNIKPSIESAAHIVLLKQTNKFSSVHVHSPNTVALASLYTQQDPELLPYILNTQWPELFRYTKVGRIVPFLDPGSKELHSAIADSIKPNKFKNFDIVILERHGIFTVGSSFEACKEHVVRLEHISNILLKIISASGKLIT